MMAVQYLEEYTDNLFQVSGQQEAG
jgi:hypothetical protein